MSRDFEPRDVRLALKGITAEKMMESYMNKAVGQRFETMMLTLDALCGTKTTHKGYWVAPHCDTYSFRSESLGSVGPFTMDPAI